MTQNVLDYSLNPSGSELMDTYLAGMAENQLTSHSGVSRPSYAQAGTFWIDTSLTPWVLKQFTGSNDITIGTLNQNSNIFIVNRALGDKNGNDIATSYVRNSGNETITGSKTYMATQYIGNSSITKGTAPASNTYYGLYFVDKNGTNWANNQLGQIQMQCAANGDNVVNINAIQQTAGSTNNAGIKVAIKQNGNAYTSAPTPTDTTSTASSQIATVGWVNSTGNNVAHLSGTETFSGDKTFTGALKSTITSTSVPNNAFSVSCAQTSSGYTDLIGLYDTTNSCRVATIRAMNRPDEHSITIGANNYNDSIASGIKISYDSSNNLTTTAHTPSSLTSNSTEIVTTAWFNNKIKVVSTSPASPTANVFYFVKES